MGLDNGIQVVKYNDEVFEKFPKTWVSTYSYSDGKHTTVEPVYMRKWWGVRNSIVDYLNYKYKTQNINDGVWDLTQEDLKEIKNIFINWLDEDEWNDDGQSIWDWEESNIAGQIGNHIADINKLLTLMEEYPSMLVQFYDSY